MRLFTPMLLTGCLLVGCSTMKSVTGLDGLPAADSPSKQFALSVGVWNVLQDTATAYVQSGESTAGQRIIIRQVDEAATRLVGTTDVMIDSGMASDVKVFRALAELNSLIAQLEGVLGKSGGR